MKEVKALRGSGIAGKLTKLRAMGAKGTLKHAKFGEGARRRYAGGGGAPGGLNSMSPVGGSPAKKSLGHPGRKAPSKGPKKGGSTVNVIVMGKEGGAGGMPLPMGHPAGALPPGGPGGPPPPIHPAMMAGAMPPPGVGGGLPPPPGAGPGGPPPPGIMRAHGGRIREAATGRFMKGGVVAAANRARGGGTETQHSHHKGYLPGSGSKRETAKDMREDEDEHTKLPRNMKGDPGQKNAEAGYDRKGMTKGFTDEYAKGGSVAKEKPMDYPTRDIAGFTPGKKVQLVGGVGTGQGPIRVRKIGLTTGIGEHISNQDNKSMQGPGPLADNTSKPTRTPKGGRT